jgi:hypothetical protein
MAKVNPGAVQISGKLGDKVITIGGRYPSYMRSVVKSGTKKDESALKTQYRRTALLNKLASEVNGVVKSMVGALKTGRFYSEVQRKLRKEPQNHRLLLLWQLRGLEAHWRFTFEKHGMPDWEVRMEKGRLVSKLRVNNPPRMVIKGTNCYSFEASLICWNNTEDPVQYDTQYTEWQKPDKKKKAFEFRFKKPVGAVHWLLCLRVVLGVNDKPDGNFGADGMRIVEAGSFDKREQAWLEELKARSGEQDTAKSETKHPIVRVKAEEIE